MTTKSESRKEQAPRRGLDPEFLEGGRFSCLYFGAAHGLDNETREMVSEDLKDALASLVDTLEVAKAVREDQIGIWRDSMRRIADTWDRKPPAPTTGQLRRAPGKRHLDDASREIVIQTIVSALWPILGTPQIAAQADYDDLILDFTRLHMARLKYEKKIAKREARLSKLLA
jgi:hypothetical protein